MCRNMSYSGSWVHVDWSAIGGRTYVSATSTSSCVWGQTGHTRVRAGQKFISGQIFDASHFVNCTWFWDVIMQITVKKEIILTDNTILHILSELETGSVRLLEHQMTSPPKQRRVVLLVCYIETSMVAECILPLLLFIIDNLDCQQ